MQITLKAARVNADLTLEEAAKELGITKNTLISYEKYRTIPDMDTGMAMARLYGASVNDLIFLPSNCALSTN
jgi:DNA-binding XRE family transcriptional regulator